MLNLKVKYLSKKNPLFLLGLIAGFSLLISGIFLSGRIAGLKKKSLQNTATLDKFLPGFNEKTPGHLGQEIGSLKAELADLFNTFDPKESWKKGDYDLAIYFVEQLDKVNQFLKLKAQEKGLTSPNLGFTEKLPSETDAVYLLSQLYGLKRTVSLGMDYGINFTSVNPGISAVQELEGLSGMKLIKSRIELVSPIQSLIEFIIELTQAVPVVSIESFSLSSKDSSYQIDLMLGHIVIPVTLAELLSPFELAQNEQGQIMPLLKRFSLEEQNFIYILRSNNPFFIAQPKQTAAVSPETGEQKPLVRFFYRGGAILKSKEVVVIEDALNQEVRFLAPGERIDDYILVDAKDDKIILKKADSGEEIIVEREK
jgi:hypothetical protein